MIWESITGIEEKMGIDNCIDFVERMLNEIGVLALPGTAFPGENSKDHLRFSFAVSKNDIKRGIERIKEWADNAT